MNTLSIKDISVTEELDSRAMSDVHGGTGLPFWPGYNGNTFSLSSNVTQLASQQQNSTILNGNNTAFSAGAVTISTPVQEAYISNH